MGGGAKKSLGKENRMGHGRSSCNDPVWGPKIAIDVPDVMFLMLLQVPNND